MHSDAPTVAAYLKSLPDDSRQALAKLRTLIRKCASGADEKMQHGMPCYELNGLLCAFAAQKNNLALYVCEPELVAKFKSRLGKVSVGKGCIRFRKIDDLSLAAVEELLRAAVKKRQAR